MRTFNLYPWRENLRRKNACIFMIVTLLTVCAFMSMTYYLNGYFQMKTSLVLTNIANLKSKNKSKVPTVGLTQSKSMSCLQSMLLQLVSLKPAYVCLAKVQVHYAQMQITANSLSYSHVWKYIKNLQGWRVQLLSAADSHHQINFKLKVSKYEL